MAEFVEVETGKGSDVLDRRPQLSAAQAGLIRDASDVDSPLEAAMIMARHLTKILLSCWLMTGVSAYSLPASSVFPSGKAIVCEKKPIKSRPPHPRHEKR